MECNLKYLDEYIVTIRSRYWNETPGFNKYLWSYHIIPFIELRILTLDRKPNHSLIENVCRKMGIIIYGASDDEDYTYEIFKTELISKGEKIPNTNDYGPDNIYAPE